MAAFLLLLRRVSATGIVMMLGVALAIGQVPVGQHHHLDAGHSDAGTADGGAGHGHAGKTPGGLAFHHCTSVQCTPQLTVLRAESVAYKLDAAASAIAVSNQDDLRSVVLARDPPVPKLFV